MTLIDTHVHLDHNLYNDDLNAVLDRGREAGVKAFVIPGANPADLAKAQTIAHAHKDVFFAAGVHPNHVFEYDEGQVRSFLNDPKCLAVGECGLDYFRLPKDETESAPIKAAQKRIFKAQIALAAAFDLPLIVHIRDASDDSLEILLNSEAARVGGVLHCFNADEQLLKLAEHGFYYGIGGVFTFTNARKLPDLSPKIPKDRLLLETDAPYLTPHPHRGKRNEPAYTALVAQALADKLQMPVEELSVLTTRNANSCFKGLQVAL
ncbi:MAG: TatD family hydrolase [Campylobacterales bacterium]